MKKILGWTVAGIVSLGGIAACSSDKAKSPTTTAATVTTGGAATSSAAADKFCADTASLVAKGPSDSGYAAGLTKLTADAQALITSNPADAAKIQECLTKIASGG